MPKTSRLAVLIAVLTFVLAVGCCFTGYVLFDRGGQFDLIASIVVATLGVSLLGCGLWIVYSTRTQLASGTSDNNTALRLAAILTAIPIAYCSICLFAHGLYILNQEYLHLVNVWRRTDFGSANVLASLAFTTVLGVGTGIGARALFVFGSRNAIRSFCGKAPRTISVPSDSTSAINPYDPPASG